MYIEGKKASRPMVIIAKIVGWFSIFGLAFLLGLLVFGLFSCQKNDEKCYDCTTISERYHPNTFVNIVVKDYVDCGINPAERTDTTYEGSTMIISTTTCKEK